MDKNHERHDKRIDIDPFRNLQITRMRADFNYGEFASVGESA